MDGSESVLDRDFESMRTFVQVLVDALDFDEALDEVFISEYSSAVTEFTNGFVRQRMEAEQAVLQLQRSFGITNTGTALNAAADAFETRMNRNSILVVLTDGRTSSNDLSNLATGAERLRSLGVTTYAIGLGIAVSPSELVQIAGDARRVYQGSFTDLLTISVSLLPMIRETCTPNFLGRLF